MLWLELVAQTLAFTVIIAEQVQYASLLPNVSNGFFGSSGTPVKSS